jgi:hypothetical protein
MTKRQKAKGKRKMIQGKRQKTNNYQKAKAKS